jgi:hypothetical protein
MMVNNNLDPVAHEMHFVHTGAYLRGYVDGTASYVEEKAYKPAGLGSPLIQIEIDPTTSSKYNRPRFAFSKLPLGY